MRGRAIAFMLLQALGGGVGARPAFAQAVTTSTFDIRSGDASVRARFFAAHGGVPVATVLIVPGWGGDSLDASGMGALLSARRVNVLLINFRGVQQSEGRFTYANAIDDLGAAWRWLHEPANRARYRIDPATLVLSGNSFGGGVAMVYAAGDTTVHRVVSIVGADHGLAARRIGADTAYASRIRGALARAAGPRGSVRFEPDSLFVEMVRREHDNDLVRLAPRLDHRSVLLVGGWDDMTAPIESEILPVYRALAARSGADATILAYPEGHSLRTQRDRVADDIVAWLNKRAPR
jgi:uncharacterized protein